MILSYKNMVFLFRGLQSMFTTDVYIPNRRHAEQVYVDIT